MTDTLHIFIYGMVAVVISAMLLAGLLLTDIATTKNTGLQEKLPCYDLKGNTFENQSCFQNITCSWLGLASNGLKCKDIQINIREDK